MAYTGLRWAEMAALTAGQVDAAGGVLVVDRALGGLRAPVGALALAIREPLADHIAGHRLDDHDVLRTPGGARCGRITGASACGTRPSRRRYWNAACPTTCASWLIAKGANPKDVMEWMGHSNLRTTMDRYAHLLPGRKPSSPPYSDEHKRFPLRRGFMAGAGRANVIQ